MMLLKTDFFNIAAATPFNFAFGFLVNLDQIEEGYQSRAILSFSPLLLLSP